MHRLEIELAATAPVSACVKASRLFAIFVLHKCVVDQVVRHRLVSEVLFAIDLRANANACEESNSSVSKVIPAIETSCTNPIKETVSQLVSQTDRRATE